MTKINQALSRASRLATRPWFLSFPLVFGLAEACQQVAAPVARDQRTNLISGVGNTKVDVNVSVENGQTKGSFSANSFYTQVLEARSGSSISGSSISIPPGALAIDTQISLGDGAGIGNDSTLERLNLDTSVSAQGPAVAIESSVPMDTATPFTISLPIPNIAGLRLTSDDPYANLSVIYFVKKVSQGAASFTGVIPRSQIDLSDGYAKVTTSFFGTFQTIITKAPILKPIEKPIEPVTKPEPPKPVPKEARLAYFVPGFLSTSFEPGRSGQRVEGLQGLFTGYSPAVIGSTAKLSTTLINFKFVEE